MTGLINITDGDPQTETAVVAGLAFSAAEPQLLERGRIYSVTDTTGRQHVLDTQQHSERPHRVGPRKVETFDPTAFLDYTGRFLGEESEDVELWANLDQRTITAVLNAAEHAGKAGWADHRAVLTLRPNKQWTTWLGVSGQLMTQVKFAEFIEDNQDDFIDPNAATMLDLARTFTAKKSVDFESSENLANGARGLLYRETITSKAGEKGTLEIPSAVTIALRPFQGAEPYRVTARLRYRIEDGNLGIGFKLHRPDTVLEDAFDSVIATVEAGTPSHLHVNHGIG
ncbi:DUF2303 family protein [Auraticoccus monumenti]|uniref:Uncharacterized conserved protein n=1 Tax=Auraticoccus monumenti TaxID=675864 RepID=A0A1G6UPS9_9ACTN|nr:DUF2303 family protein [Auraticoccus monumenti]SDD43293.1 Uncharacterized conserved protein [Auraticoccus monumenti]